MKLIINSIYRTWFSNELNSHWTPHISRNWWLSLVIKWQQVFPVLYHLPQYSSWVLEMILPECIKLSLKFPILSICLLYSSGLFQNVGNNGCNCRLHIPQCFQFFANSSSLSASLLLLICRHDEHNSSPLRKWSQQLKINPWIRLFAFNVVPILFGKTSTCFSPSYG